MDCEFGAWDHAGGGSGGYEVFLGVRAQVFGEGDEVVRLQLILKELDAFVIHLQKILISVTGLDFGWSKAYKLDCIQPIQVDCMKLGTW